MKSFLFLISINKLKKKLCNYFCLLIDCYLVIFLPPPKPKDKFFKFKVEIFEKPCTRLSKILPMLLSVNYSPIIVYYENYLIINE